MICGTETVSTVRDVKRNKLFPENIISLLVKILILFILFQLSNVENILLFIITCKILHIIYREKISESMKSFPQNVF